MGGPRRPPSPRGRRPTTVAIQGAKGASLQSTPPPQSQHTSVAAKLLEEKSAKLPVRTHSLAFKDVGVSL